MNRGRISTQVFLCFLVMMFLMVIGCSKSDDTLPTYNISGAVTGATAVTINLTGAATATTTTDTSGNYSFTGLANGTYTVTPVKTGYIFNPVSSVVAVSGANVTGRNFVATTYDGLTYSISGAISGAASSGVTITLSGANTASVVTGVGGTYSISGLVPGSYTVTPSLTGFTFNPTSTAVTITAANSTANNFVATAIPVVHSISGTVTALGLPLSGVTITVTGTATATATTNASGVFNVTGLYDGGYTVTPSKTGYTFTPSSSAVTMSGADVTGKNFTAAVYVPPTHSISGAVSGDVLLGVTITLSGDGTASTTTNTSGNYSFSGIANGNYTVTPSMTGYTFSPANAAVSVSSANVTVPNFVATAIPTTYTASGTWTWNSGTSTLTMVWTSSNFTCNGPSLGTQTMTNPTIGATTMIMGDMTWTRSPAGPVGDARGTWTATDSGNTYTLVISGDTSGTMSLTATIVSCGGNGENPYAQSQHWSGGYSVSLAYDDSPKTATSVSVTGHGITGSKVLTYNTGDGSWNSWTSPSTQVDFGTTYPTGLPFTYTFSITDPTTRTATSTVSCFQERFATNLSPTGTVTGTPTFSWTGIGDSSATYGVELNDSSGNNRIWRSYNISGTSIVYGGPALTSGATYNYNVLVMSSSACSNQSSFAQGSFTHQ